MSNTQPAMRPRRPSATQTGQSERSTLRIHPERAAHAEAAEILASGIVAHVAFVADGQPFVIPMTYHFDPSERTRLYLHGAHHSRLVRQLAAGTPVCVSVSLIDGLVYSRTALHHSVNYRSVVCFGRAVDAPDSGRRRTLLEAMIARYFRSRRSGEDYAPIPDVHLDGTAFIAIELEEWSAKVRRGPPTGPHDADPMAPGTAGVVELGDPR